MCSSDLFELQNDQPGKLHSWHRHSLDEELFVLRGSALMFWDADGTYQERDCKAGTWVTLPAGTVHGSLAGPEGTVYMIRPRDGRTAETTASTLSGSAIPMPSPRPIHCSRLMSLTPRRRSVSAAPRPAPGGHAHRARSSRSGRACIVRGRR